MTADPTSGGHFSSSLVLMILSMLCWGSWANTFSFCRGRYRFELFYWDYSLGVLLGALGFYLALGPGLDLWSGPHLLWGVLAGVVFNIGNVFLVAAISMAGMAVAFPLCIGLALVLGVGLSWWVTPTLALSPLLLGAVLLLSSIALAASAYRGLPGNQASSGRGVVIAIIGGVFMGLFPPCLQEALVGPGALGTSTATLALAVGVFGCTLTTNWLFMRRPLAGEAPVSGAGYWDAPPLYHGVGLLGGAIWVAGLVFNSLAAEHVSVAVSYAFGTGATLVAVLWGVLVWGEFRRAPKRSVYALIGMFATFLAGILVIAWAKAMRSAG